MFIFLIGYMLSGKTTVGKSLADRLGVPFFDLDQEIESYCQMPVRDIFSIYGEPVFRAKERKVLRSIVHSHSLVKTPYVIVATGGGTPCFSENLKLMKESGVVCYLIPTLETIALRVDEIGRQPDNLSLRPLLSASVDDMANHIALRQSFYSQADFSVEISSSDSPSDVVDKICNCLKKK